MTPLSLVICLVMVCLTLWCLAYRSDSSIPIRPRSGGCGNGAVTIANDVVNAGFRRGGRFLEERPGVVLVFDNVQSGEEDPCGEGQCGYNEHFEEEAPDARWGIG